LQLNRRERRVWYDNELVTMLVGTFPEKEEQLYWEIKYLTRLDFFDGSLGLYFVDVAVKRVFMYVMKKKYFTIKIKINCSMYAPQR